MRCPCRGATSAQNVHGDTGSIRAGDSNLLASYFHPIAYPFTSHWTNLQPPIVRRLCRMHSDYPLVCRSVSGGFVGMVSVWKGLAGFMQNQHAWERDL